MPNQNQSLKILAIKPATKCLGIAVLDNKDLIYWKIKVIRGKKIPSSQAVKKLRIIINKLVDFFSPQAIAVENIFYNQAKMSSLLNILVKEIKVMGKARGVKVRFYPPLPVREFICQNEKPTKMNAARILAADYPLLHKDYEDEKAKPWWKAKYKLKIFDAVAVGLYCHSKLKARSKEYNVY